MRIGSSCIIALMAIGSLSFSQQPTLGAAPAPANALLTPAETNDIDSVIAAVMTAGFPDTKGAVVYNGKISISASSDPKTGAAPLPTEASKTQMSGPEPPAVIYGYEFDGLHFKLADGSWIISLAYHFKPRPGDTVNVDAATEVKLATLTTDATAAHPFDADKQAGKWLQRVAPAQRDRARASMNRIVPVTNYLRLGSDSLAPATLFLSRAGWKDADDLCFAAADQRARNYWQLRLWTEANSPFDPTGAYPASKEEQETWMKAHPDFTSEPPAVALRRSLFRWCRAQLYIPDVEDRMLSLETAAAACKATVDPNDPQGNIARVDALLAGAKLPVVPANADLVARLQSWELRPRQPKMAVSTGNNGLSFTTSFTAPPPAYEPSKTDLDALVALLGDERPSRCVDFSGPRTVGDNAWRALATLLNADPRTLAGHATDKPWTNAERRAAAGAVQTWWKAHRGEYAGK